MRLHLPLIMAQVGDVLTPPVLEASVREHRVIAEAILARDPEAAAARMREHLERAAAVALKATRRSCNGGARERRPGASRAALEPFALIPAFLSSLRGRSGCARRCPIVRGGATRFCGLIASETSRFGRFCEASVMMTVWISLGVAALTFAFGLAGLYLQKLLPEGHTSDRSREMIGAVIGLISLLLALVLGTLIGSAYSFYSTQKSEMETFASRALQLDMALAEYGPETAAARAQMKDTLTMVRRMLWWRDESGTMRPDFTVAEPIPHLKATDEYVASLDPKTAAQKQFQAAAAGYASAMEQTRLLISLQLASPVSWPLVGIVVSWAMILFCGFGVLSRINATTIAALAFGAFAVGSALFLILELSQPFTGVFRLPSAAIDQMLASLDK